MSNRIIMIGDSITAGFDIEAYFPNEKIINKGVPGDSSVECLERISNDWFFSAPDTVFLCIGTNDLARDRRNSVIAENIRSIVEKIRQFSGTTLIHITSIFPTRDNEPRPNERILTLNAQLKKLSVDLGCLYFDLHQHFIDSDGKLKEEFTDDGLHLTENGYRTWSRVFEEYRSTL